MCRARDIIDFYIVEHFFPSEHSRVLLTITFCGTLILNEILTCIRNLKAQIMLLCQRS